MKSFISLVIFILGIFFIQGCSKTPEIVQKEDLHVDVIYLDKRMLPPNAKVTVILEDISKQDVKSEIIAKQSLMVKNAPPYTFIITFDTNSIDYKHTYSLSANITVDGKYIYRSDEILNPFSEIREKYTIVLKRVAMTKSLVNRPWTLVSLNEEDISLETSAKKPFIMFDSDGKGVKGFTGCNNMFGSYTKDGYNIKIGPLASTRKACMANMDVESKFQKAINDAKKWKMSGDNMYLIGADDKTLAKFTSK